jgi:hypothetical protein
MSNKHEFIDEKYKTSSMGLYHGSLRVTGSDLNLVNLLSPQHEVMQVPKQGGFDKRGCVNLQRDIRIRTLTYK